MPELIVNEEQLDTGLGLKFLEPNSIAHIAARAVQGLGGAVVSAVALSLIMNLFSEPGERARAMGVYGFVCAGGGSLGVLLGGLLTSAFSRHCAVWAFSRRFRMIISALTSASASCQQSKSVTMAMVA